MSRWERRKEKGRAWYGGSEAVRRHAGSRAVLYAVVRCVDPELAEDVGSLRQSVCHKAAARYCNTSKRAVETRIL